jgi:hypothetical protein
LKPLGQDLKNNTGHFLVNNGGLFGLITGGKPLFGKRETTQETKGVATDFLIGNLRFIIFCFFILNYFC